MDRDPHWARGGEHQANYRHLYSTLCIFRNDDCRNSLAALSYDVSSLLIPNAPTSNLVQCQFFSFLFSI